MAEDLEAVRRPVTSEVPWHQYVTDESWRETTITTTSDDYAQSRRWLILVDELGALIVIENP